MIELADINNYPINEDRDISNGTDIWHGRCPLPFRYMFLEMFFWFYMPLRKGMFLRKELFM